MSRQLQVWAKTPKGYELYKRDEIPEHIRKIEHMVVWTMGKVYSLQELSRSTIKTCLLNNFRDEFKLLNAIHKLGRDGHIPMTLVSDIQEQEYCSLTTRMKMHFCTNLHCSFFIFGEAYSSAMLFYDNRKICIPL